MTSLSSTHESLYVFCLRLHSIWFSRGIAILSASCIIGLDVTWSVLLVNVPVVVRASLLLQVSYVRPLTAGRPRKASFYRAECRTCQSGCLMCFVGLEITHVIYLAAGLIRAFTSRSMLLASRIVIEIFGCRARKQC